METEKRMSSLVDATIAKHNCIGNALEKVSSLYISRQIFFHVRPLRTPTMSPTLLKTSEFCFNKLTDVFVEQIERDCYR